MPTADGFALCNPFCMSWEERPEWYRQEADKELAQAIVNGPAVQTLENFTAIFSRGEIKSKYQRQQTQSQQTTSQQIQSQQTTSQRTTSQQIQSQQTTSQRTTSQQIQSQQTTSQQTTSQQIQSQQPQNQQMQSQTSSSNANSLSGVFGKMKINEGKK